MNTDTLTELPTTVQMAKKCIAINQSILIQMEDMIASYFNEIDHTTGNLIGDLAHVSAQMKLLACDLRVL